MYYYSATLSYSQKLTLRWIENSIADSRHILVFTGSDMGRPGRKNLDLKATINIGPLTSSNLFIPRNIIGTYCGKSLLP